MDYSEADKEALRAWALTKPQGHHRRQCFACAETRHNKKAATLSVTIDHEKALWICFHCEASGGLRLYPSDRDERKQDYAFTEKRWQPESDRKPKPKGAVRVIGKALDAMAMAFMKSRGISEKTANHYGVVYARAWFHDLEREAPGVAIPYIVNDRLVGHKVRCSEEKANVCDHALSSLCGINHVDMDESSDLIVCEGEMDMLACYEAGILNPTSVPNGSSSFTRSEGGDDKATMGFLWSAKKEIDKAKRILIAADADDAGDKLANEMARRIGKHRCWRVSYREGCKDANDVLLRFGGAILKDCIAKAEPWPVEGLHEAAVYTVKVSDLFDHGVGERTKTGMVPVDELYSCDPGLLTIVTGIPAAGKSTFIDQLMVNLSRTYGHQFAICSFENPIHVHIAKLAEMLLQKHFFEGDDKPGQRMTKDELEGVLPFINTHFKFLSQDDGKKATLESIIERIKTAVFRWGVRGAVIDPYNYIARPKSADNETGWIDDMLTQLRLVAECHGIHLWLVAHPTKMVMDSEGNYPPPKGYSISGSAAWFSKTDFGLTVHRVPDRKGMVRIINWKTRFDWMGREGECTILYDNQTNTFMTDVLGDLHPYKNMKDAGYDDGYLN